MKMYVSTANRGPLNMRAASSSAAKIIAQIPYNTEVEVEKINDEWMLVSYNGKQGYCMSKFLVSSASPTPVSKEDLQNIYNDLHQALETIKNILK